jgi:hypothetical protein
MGLGLWGKRWVRRTLSKENLDPVLLMWDMRRRLDASRLPNGSTLVMFWFRDLAAKRSRYWLHIDRPEVDVCLTNPGFPVALTIETTLSTMVAVWMGERAIQDAIRSGAIELKGASTLTRQFPSWLLMNAFAQIGTASALPSESEDEARSVRS